MAELALTVEVADERGVGRLVEVLDAELVLDERDALLGDRALWTISPCRRVRGAFSSSSLTRFETVWIVEAIRTLLRIDAAPNATEKRP